MFAWMKSLFRREPGLYLTMFVPQELLARLAEMRRATGQADDMGVICSALATYDYLVQAELRGSRLIVRDPGGRESEFSAVRREEV